MTDPNLSEQLESEKIETGIVLAEDQPAIEVESTEDKPAAPVKLYYKANRHDRRRAAARARRERGKK